jgi:putative hemolysin
LPPIVVETLIIFALVLANGFFAGAEIAIIAARRGRLKQQAEAGDRGSRIALELAENPNRFLSTVQVGITLVGTLAAAFGGAELAPLVAQHLKLQELNFWGISGATLSLGLVVMGLAYFQLVLGELVPKRFALRHAESLARIVALPMRFVESAAKPLVWFMGRSTDVTLALIGAHKAPNVSVQIEDIQHLIKTGTAEGVFDLSEQQVALEALQLGERPVRDVMRPRIELDALDIDTPAEEVIGTVAMAGFSRLPVYEGDLDHVLGYVHIKDLFRQQYLGWPINLRKLLRPALFVPETLPLDRLLKLFQEEHTQLALVLDEYGGTEGMVTLEDVVQELVGEIHDEHHRDEQQSIVRRPDGSWLVDGRVSIDEMIERLELKVELPDERGYSTVAGLILDELGAIPKVGERLTWQGVSLEVIDMDGPRIDRVLVHAAAEAPGDESGKALEPGDG